MYNAKIVEKAKKRAQELISKRETDLKNKAADRQEAEQLLDKANADMSAAVTAQDLDAYAKAKKAAEDASTRIELDDKVIASIKSRVPEEAETTIESLKAALVEKDEECYKKVLAHFNAVKDIYKDYLLEDKKIRDALIIWIRDVAKQTDWAYTYISKTHKLADALSDPDYLSAVGYIPYQRLDVSLREELKIK